MPICEAAWPWLKSSNLIANLLSILRPIDLALRFVQTRCLGHEGLVLGLADWGNPIPAFELLDCIEHWLHTKFRES